MCIKKLPFSWLGLITAHILPLNILVLILINFVYNVTTFFKIFGFLFFLVLEPQYTLHVHSFLRAMASGLPVYESQTSRQSQKVLKKLFADTPSITVENAIKMALKML